MLEFSGEAEVAVGRSLSICGLLGQRQQVPFTSGRTDRQCEAPGLPLWSASFIAGIVVVSPG